MTTTFTDADLVPTAWRRIGPVESCHVFNPALTRFRGEWLLAYRVVLGDGRRRLAICRLNAQLEVVADSVTALSDAVVGADQWQADARFCTLGERLLLHFNSGAKRPNQIHVVELDVTTLLPLGPARPLVHAGARQVVEKNWMLFEHEGALLAIYCIAPHVVMRLAASGDQVVCTPAEASSWDAAGYAFRYGAPRGGTPPVRVGERYFSFFHSVYQLPRWHRRLHRLMYGRGRRTRRYVAGFYSFAAEWPFTPLSFTPVPVLHASARSTRRALNPGVDRVAYPCGAVFHEGNWIVSFGLNDEQCCLQVFSHAALLSQMVPAVS